MITENSSQNIDNARGTQKLRKPHIPVSPILNPLEDLNLAPNEILEIDRKSFLDMGMERPTNNAWGYERYKIFKREKGKKVLYRHYIRFLFDKEEKRPTILIPGTVSIQYKITDETRGLIPQKTTKKKKIPNAGIDHGIIQLLFVDKKSGAIQTGYWHVIEAIEGTWLSEACKKFGWDKEYGPEDKYGALVEGVVRRTDGGYVGIGIMYPDADIVKPGELYAIQIYENQGKSKTRGKKPKPEIDTEIEPNFLHASDNQVPSIASITCQ